MHRSVASLVILLLCLSRLPAVVAQPQAPLLPTPDPAASVAGGGGDWISFMLVDPRPLTEGQRRALLLTLEALLHAARLAPWTGRDADDPVLARGLSMARQGRPIAAWALPGSPPVGHPAAAIALRIWGDQDPPAEALAGLRLTDSHGRGDLPWRDALARNAATPTPVESPISPEAVGEWPRHREAAGALNPSGRPVVLELAINVNACRHAYGAAFDAGRGSVMLDTARLANARVIGLHAWVLPASSVSTRDPSLPRVAGVADHAYSGPDLLCVAVSWSARSQPPGTVRARLCTTPFWPLQQLGPPPAPEAGSIALAARAPWRAMIPAWLDLYAASLEASDRDAFTAARATWSRDGGAAADRLALNLAPYLAVIVQPADDHAVIRWHVPIKPDTSPAALAPLVSRAFAAVQSSFQGDPAAGLADLAPFAAARWKPWSGAMGLDASAANQSGQPAGTPAFRGRWLVRPVTP